MRTKKRFTVVLVAILSIVFSFATYAQERFVVAGSGLKLRVSPDMESSMLVVIPKGKKVNIIESAEMTGLINRIDWLDGAWVKVEYRGIKGYVFDGFISSLALPDGPEEMTGGSFDLAFPLENYALNHFMIYAPCDTLGRGDTFTKILYLNEEGETMETTEDEFYFETSLNLKNISMAEAFNLICNMTNSKSERKFLVDNSLFIEGNDAKVKEIRIKGGANVVIKKIGDGFINIKAIVHYFA